MRVLFLDRDGTLIREPDDYRVDAPAKLVFLPGVIPALLRLTAAGWKLVIVSNQDGLGSAEFPWAAFQAPHDQMLATFASGGVHFDDVLVDTHYERDNHPMRKPNPGMVLAFVAQYPQVDLAASYVIGDRKTDAHLALNAGCQSLTIKDPDSRDGDLRIPHVPPAPTRTFTTWPSLADFLLGGG